MTDPKLDLAAIEARIKSCPRHPHWSGMVWDCAFCNRAVARVCELEAEMARYARIVPIHREQTALANDVARAATARADDAEAAHRIASGAADRFRDLVEECLGLDENPGDDALVAGLRAHFGKTGPESRRWRDFMVGAEAMRDQIIADRLATPTTTEGSETDGE